MSKYTVFDLETMGLKPVTDEIISFVVGEHGQIQNEERTEIDLLKGFSEHIRSLPTDTILLTYMGGRTYSPGKMAFDLPVLRTKYVMNNLTHLWPLKGRRHIDVFPLIKNGFILDFEDVGVISDMDTPGVNKMAKAMNIRPESTKGATMKSIEELVPEIQINQYLKEKGIMKNKTHDGLKDACLYLMKIKDDGMRGKEVPGLFTKWKETKDPDILDKILTYNIADCEKTLKLFLEIKEVLPDDMLRVDIL